MSEVFIIAEAGVNHNGDLKLAKEMVEKASDAGADAIKFQTFKAENLVTKDAKKAQYQCETTEAEESQYAMLKKLELSEEAFAELKEYCETCGIAFLSTPFDVDSLQFLLDLGMETIKVPSGEITNYPLLREIGKSNRDVILSTGMCELNDIEAAIKVLREFGCPDITVLHCNTEYPTPYSDVNLKAMETIREKFQVSVGYSDHSEGIEIPLAAVAMGAKVIEKHFTLDRNMEGPDHKASLEPNELEEMVTAIRNIEMAMGSGIKEPSASEKKNIEVARKSIVAKEFIPKGTMFTESNLTTKRPGKGISPMDWEKVVGQYALRDFYEDEMIEL